MFKKSRACRGFLLPIFRRFVVAEERSEAAIDDAVVARPGRAVGRAHCGCWFCDRFVAVAHHLDRSLAPLLSDYEWA